MKQNQRKNQLKAMKQKTFQNLISTNAQSLNIPVFKNRIKNKNMSGNMSHSNLTTNEAEEKHQILNQNQYSEYGEYLEECFGEKNQTQLLKMEVEQLRRENRFLKHKICEMQTGDKQIAKKSRIKQNLQEESSLLQTLFVNFQKFLLQTLQKIDVDIFQRGNHSNTQTLGRELQKVALKAAQERYLSLLELFQQYYLSNQHLFQQFKKNSNTLLMKMTQIQAKIYSLQQKDKMKLKSSMTISMPDF